MIFLLLIDVQRYTLESVFIFQSEYLLIYSIYIVRKPPTTIWYTKTRIKTSIWMHKTTSLIILVKICIWCINIKRGRLYGYNVCTNYPNLRCVSCITLKPSLAYFSQLPGFFLCYNLANIITKKWILINELFQVQCI